MEKLVKKYLETKEILENRADEIYEMWSDYFNSGYGHVDKLEFNNNSVDIYWEDSWRYGGHDEGRLNIPMNVFYGDWEKWINDKIEEDKNFIIEKKKKESIVEVAEEKRQLKKQLKKQKEKQAQHSHPLSRRL